MVKLRFEAQQSLNMIQASLICSVAISLVWFGSRISARE